jgi:hypothetical protein
MAGFTEAYEKAGYVLANPRNDWAAIKPDRSAVALTVWQDQIVKGQDPLFMDCRGALNLAEWKDRQGNHKRIQAIKHSLTHCDGMFDFILCVAVAVAVKASPRKIATATHWARMRGHIGIRSTILMEPFGLIFGRRESIRAAVVF